MNRIMIFLSALLFSICTFAAGEGRLFFIERSKNSNIVCYDVVVKNNTLDTSKPLDVYWIKNEEDGKREGLSLIERKLAYGYKVVSKGNNEATIKLSAYDKQSVRICKQKNKWVALITIKGKECQLTKLYVKAKPTNSLSVEYVELRGISTATGEEVVDRIKE
ncbi:MAG: DUF4833 domain-containing protein [Bacteroidaceae bacterium]|nr:DUF4833 domain-containing protein [Bacteroidaceae bacterium]